LGLEVTQLNRMFEAKLNLEVLLTSKHLFLS